MKTPESDPFYVAVLNSAIRSGALNRAESVLVVCGGSKDEASLRAAGLANFTISNISGDVTVDTENLPFPDGSFDTVIVHSGLHHCSSPHRGLLEMHRVARSCIILFEPADTLATRLGRKLGVGQTYEFAAVANNGLNCGGWRNTAVPNWIYRFTASEIRQTICCAAPFGPHGFHFHYRTRVPWTQLKMRRNKIPLILALLAAPILRALDAIGPVFSNNMAAVILKPRFPSQVFPWLEQQGANFVAQPGWFGKKFARPDA